MVKRLNLAKVHCDSLELAARIKLSHELAEKVLNGSHGHDRRGVRYLSVYGSLYTLGGVPHVIVARVRRAQEGDYLLELRYLREDRKRPPRDIRPVGVLMLALADEPQPVNFQCETILTYDETSGWRSIMDVPLAIWSDEEGEWPFSHLEGVRFSRRQGGRVEYFIQVRRNTAGALVHWVSLEERRELSPDVPRYFLDRSVALSQMLLRRG
ncbi:MAG: hypothetical protein ABSG55_02715 [Dehalococcoidia bacterium]